ncbi:hypothetical protein LCGC14_2862840 [marine sediment metagenome]|uniref:Uncharacterized protein n=1 Tax=marine sediment metagenome TaxID=412755 RepID=A0A0F9ADH8_9ZZZZ
MLIVNNPLEKLRALPSAERDKFIADLEAGQGVDALLALVMGWKYTKQKLIPFWTNADGIATPLPKASTDAAAFEPFWDWLVKDVDRYSSINKYGRGYLKGQAQTMKNIRISVAKAALKEHCETHQEADETLEQQSSRKTDRLIKGLRDGDKIDPEKMREQITPLPEADDVGE